MTTIGMILRPRRKRTRSDRVEQDGNVAEQHEQDADQLENDMVDNDAIDGLLAFGHERVRNDDAANGLVALRTHDDIVFEKVQDDNVVNAVFEGYDDETQGKVIVVAEEKER